MIHQSFINVLGQPKIIGEIDTSKLKTIFSEQLNKIQDSSILLEYLEYYGISIFNEGFFSFIDPMDYEISLKKFPKLKEHSIMPFAKTPMGNFYLIGEVDDEKCIAFYNIHTEEYKYVVDEFTFFMETLAGSVYHRESEWYGNIELPALEKYGPVEIDECLTFVPALVLGGDEDIRNIQKVKLKENLEILSQAFS
ncbi:T6SS immunity protein Tdi1 domain-containing protein [Chryseobacterium sp. CFBP8996]|jgi:hypothetical protein|uniref:T6SS immunity protein Tdi1 domain-containing protein n=1 Tax=Chryseobacterium sp. CFBP8996 TaxID=3096529 RepID=UPI002A6AA3AC|nr:T6SS immunity protein Tdi1 domain-containing protein [Chryseobacterium sp. CFBP8996]MDY0933122.1 DUF1851 domain-containing protein [Chryseobacterium sp. CFBP8996]